MAYSGANQVSQSALQSQIGMAANTVPCARIEPSIAGLLARLHNLASDAEARASTAAEIVDRLNGVGAPAAGCNTQDASGMPASGVIVEFEAALRRLSSALNESDASLSEIARKIG